MTIVYIFLAAFGVMSVSLVGIITATKKLTGWAERNLKYLATFATGVFIVVAYRLVNETFHSGIETTSIFGIIAFGIIVGFLIDKTIPYSHHHHDQTESPNFHTKSGAHRIIISDSLHNITDGFLIVPAFLVDVRLGIITTLGIIVHEVAQEISEYFVLKSAGYSTKRALTINFVTSTTIILGVITALFVTNISEDVISILLAIAAGIIIFTIFKDLIPYSFSVAQREKTYFKHFVAALAGALLIAGLTVATANTHSHSEAGLSDDEQHTHNDEHPDEHNKKKVLDSLLLDEQHKDEYYQ